MITADFHTHTSFSTDSEAAPIDMLNRAVDLGLTTYCITDHMDWLFPDGKDLFIFDPDRYFATLNELRERFRGKLDLRIGIELGLRNEPDLVAPVTERYETLLREYPFDFAIGSTHCICHVDPYYPDIWNTLSPDDVTERYLDALDFNVKHYNGFQVCGHLDYILRYVPNGRYANIWKFADRIESVLRTLIHKDIGLEVNSNALRSGFCMPNPGASILHRYYELGGRLLTIGSDAHRPEDIAADFDRIADLLRALGFREYATFSNRTPEFHPL